MASIRVTPETLDSQGNELKGYGKELENILKSIDSKINEIIDEWDGLSQDAYFDMYSEMKQSLDQFPDLVDALGNATVAAAKAFSQVDDELKIEFSKFATRA